MEQDLNKFTALILKNKTHNMPWTYQIFSNEESARSYFDKRCVEFGWNFSWEDYELVEVEIRPHYQV